MHKIEINDIDMNKLALKPGFFQGKIAINRPVFIHKVADLQADTKQSFSISFLFLKSTLWNTCSNNVCITFRTYKVLNLKLGKSI